MDTIMRLFVATASEGHYYWSIIELTVDAVDG